ncbi:MAG: GTP 3',8-cyclase MoaA, partial [Anaerolineae bacterium]|nr:GTP 3',8-cyclase MoaA [Anaerolineae bacterium]
INYLRISVTDRCNLRCVYCMPEEGVSVCAHDDILRYEEIETVVRAAARLGIHKVRLTGGEPLVRLGLTDLVRMLAQVPGIDDLSMTTNGILLSRHADGLAQAGLNRVNISLDTLKSERFAQITRRGRLEDVLAGIDAAHRAGLEPVKINAVIMRGVNDDEVIDLARKTVSDGWHVRFIEWMPIAAPVEPVETRWQSQMVTAAEMRATIEAALGLLEPAQTENGAGPAKYYRLTGAAGTVGFITPISEHFCAHCNRLRLTADGQLRPCLLSDFEIDLRTSLRQGADVDEIEALLRQGIGAKPARHHLAESERVENRVMAQIGG